MASLAAGSASLQADALDSALAVIMAALAVQEAWTVSRGQRCVSRLRRRADLPRRTPMGGSCLAMDGGAAFHLDCEVGKARQIREPLLIRTCRLGMIGHY